MPYKCFMIEVDELGGKWRKPGEQEWSINTIKPVGAMFFFAGDLHAIMPSGGLWNIDHKGKGWKRTGEPPRITVTPSINHVGQYHGWLANGIFTDDSEGRKFKDSAHAE